MPDFRPFLYVVPLAMMPHKAILAHLGVMEEHSAGHYASALCAIALEANDSPLDETKLAMALQLADCTAEAQQHHGGSCTRLRLVTRHRVTLLHLFVTQFHNHLTLSKRLR